MHAKSHSKVFRVVKASRGVEDPLESQIVGKVDKTSLHGRKLPASLSPPGRSELSSAVIPIAVEKTVVKDSSVP